MLEWLGFEGLVWWEVREIGTPLRTSVVGAWVTLMDFKWPALSLFQPAPFINEGSGNYYVFYSSTVSCLRVQITKPQIYDWRRKMPDYFIPFGNWLWASCFEERGLGGNLISKHLSLIYTPPQPRYGCHGTFCIGVSVGQDVSCSICIISVNPSQSSEVNINSSYYRRRNPSLNFIWAKAL